MINLKQLTPEGVYSFTRPGCSYQIVNIMRGFMKASLKDLVITDGTACCGGDTLRFSLEFNKVNAVEKNAENFAALEVNCDDTSNVCLFNGDYTSLANVLKQDVVYLDPPWGGREYWKLPSLKLMVGDLNVHEIVKYLLVNNKARYVFIKAPTNVWLDGFNNLECVARFEVKRVTKSKGSEEFYKIICIAGPPALPGPPGPPGFPALPGPPGFSMAQAASGAPETSGN